MQVAQGRACSEVNAHDLGARVSETSEQLLLKQPVAHDTWASALQDCCSFYCAGSFSAADTVQINLMAQ
jgi:hypothetical protein